MAACVRMAVEAAGELAESPGAEAEEALGRRWRIVRAHWPPSLPPQIVPNAPGSGKGASLGEQDHPLHMELANAVARRHE